MMSPRSSAWHDRSWHAGGAGGHGRTERGIVAGASAGGAQGQQPGRRDPPEPDGIAAQYRRIPDLRTAVDDRLHPGRPADGTGLAGRVPGADVRVLPGVQRHLRPLPPRSKA
ncbi:hypothetical protein LP420_13100 [Massilia sp. B-10]|nr:hypothetical protein LP420_13100 [Massilia sp. B-10]